MKVITEAMLREQLRRDPPAVYIVREGTMLSPAAREYLNDRRIRFEKEKPAAQAAAQPAAAKPPAPGGAGTGSPRYVDDETGAFYGEKPENMTHIAGNRLVLKSHPRIALRGKLDSLQALTVLTQAELLATGKGDKIVEDLEDVLRYIRELVRCEVLELPLPELLLLGLDSATLREHSHHPQKYYNVAQMTLPHCRQDVAYLKLNVLRTQAREAELAAVRAFPGKDGAQIEYIRALNRLSSCLHVMMCRHLGGFYAK